VALDLRDRRGDMPLLQFVCVGRAVFEKVPALNAIAPTQTESPFKLTQLVVLMLSTMLAIVTVIR
jgi:hypothetical protein